MRKPGSPCNPYAASSPDSSKDGGSSPFLDPLNPSKIILPPLGVSSYNQNSVKSKGRIISPMDSRYR